MRAISIISQHSDDKYPKPLTLIIMIDLACFDVAKKNNDRSRLWRFKKSSWEFFLGELMAQALGNAMEKVIRGKKERGGRAADD